MKIEIIHWKKKKVKAENNKKKIIKMDQLESRVIEKMGELMTRFNKPVAKEDNMVFIVEYHDKLKKHMAEIIEKHPEKIMRGDKMLSIFSDNPRINMLKLMAEHLDDQIFSDYHILNEMSERLANSMNRPFLKKILFGPKIQDKLSFEDRYMMFKSVVIELEKEKKCEILLNYHLYFEAGEWVVGYDPRSFYPTTEYNKDDGKMVMEVYLTIKKMKINYNIIKTVSINGNYHQGPKC